MCKPSIELKSGFVLLAVLTWFDQLKCNRFCQIQDPFIENQLRLLTIPQSVWSLNIGRRLGLWTWSWSGPGLQKGLLDQLLGLVEIKTLKWNIEITLFIMLWKAIYVATTNASWLANSNLEWLAWRRKNAGLLFAENLALIQSDLMLRWNSTWKGLVSNQFFTHACISVSQRRDVDQKWHHNHNQSCASFWKCVCQKFGRISSQFDDYFPHPSFLSTSKHVWKLKRLSKFYSKFSNLH